MNEGAFISNNIEETISVEDAMISVNIVKKALSHRDYIKEGVFGEDWNNLSEQQQIDEFLTPRISLFFHDEAPSLPVIFMRVIGTEGPIAQVQFYAIEAAWSFLDEGRQFARQSKPENCSPEEIEKLAFNLAVEMMVLMIDNIYKRSLFMMDSFTMETIAQWRDNKNNFVHGYLASKGEDIPKPKPIELDLVLRSYKKTLQELWKYNGQTQINWQKRELVIAYEELFRHWKILLGFAINSSSDWKEYAKAGKFSDTPDDLLERLQNIDRTSEESETLRISEIALEHSARRVFLIKRSGVSDWAKKKRKAGVMVSGYSPQQLFNYLKEGKELKVEFERNLENLKRMSVYPNSHENDPEQKRRRDSYKRKISFALKNQ